MPPQNLIIEPDDPWKVKQYKSIQALSQLLAENEDDEIQELVATMIEFEAECMENSDESN